MKLVDILARELKVWPESVVRISQMTSGDIWGALADGRFACVGIATLADDFGMKPVLRAEWQAAVDALKVAEGIADAEAGNLASLDAAKNKWEIRRNARTVADLIECGYLVSPSLHHQWVGRAYRFEAKPEWSEDGLPNVGTKCVIYKGTWPIRETAEQFIGPVVTVAARFKTSTGTEMAAIDGGPDLGCEVFRADMCFHLPTAEEIAAENAAADEREKDIMDICNSPGLRNGKGFVAIAIAMYEEGFRKQVTK